MFVVSDSDLTMCLCATSAWIRAHASVIGLSGLKYVETAVIGRGYIADCGPCGVLCVQLRQPVV